MLAPRMNCFSIKLAKTAFLNGRDTAHPPERQGVMTVRQQRGGTTMHMMEVHQSFFTTLLSSS